MKKNRPVVSQKFRPWPSFEHTKKERTAGTRVLWMAVGGSVLFHAIMAIAFPWSSVFRRFPESQEPVVQLALDLEPHFIETNPLASSNEPDKASYVAARDQQRAQEVLDDLSEKEDPKMNGSEEISQAIVEGQLDNPMELFIDMPESEAIVVANLRKQDAPGDEKRELSEDGWQTESVEDRGDDGDLIMLSVPLMDTSTVERPKPKPRPKLSARAVPAPLRKNESYISEIGRLAVDAKLSPFGIYRQQMLEMVSKQWYLLASHLRFVAGDSGSQVILEVRMDKSGSVVDVRVVRSTASQSATYVCQDAVLSRAPFEPWPEEMIAVYGDEQSIRMHFYYQ